MIIDSKFLGPKIINIKGNKLKCILNSIQRHILGCHCVIRFTEKKLSTLKQCLETMCLPIIRYKITWLYKTFQKHNACLIKNIYNNNINIYQIKTILCTGSHTMRHSEHNVTI